MDKVSKLDVAWDLFDKASSQVGLKKAKYAYTNPEEVVQELVDEVKRLREANKEILKEASKGEEGKSDLRVIKSHAERDRYKNLYNKALGELKTARWRANFYTNVYDRSRVLTALHYVWCLGYCYAPLESMTPLLIEDAAAHIERMKTWWRRRYWKTNRSKFEAMNPKETETLMDSVYRSELERHKAEELRAGKQIRDLVIREIDMSLERLEDK